MLKYIEDVSLYWLARSSWIRQISWKHINGLVSSVAQSCLTLCDPVDYTRLPCPSPTPRAYSNSWPSSQRCHPNILLWHPLLLTPSIFPSIRGFSNESILHIRWPKHWSFSISSSNEYSELISFRIDWLDLLTVQGILKSLLQHYSSKASIVQHSTLLSKSHIHTWLLKKKQQQQQKTT